MSFLNAIKEFWGTVKALGEITHVFARNICWNSGKSNIDPGLPERYELHHGAFREEFERGGKASYCFYLHPADTHFYDIDESFVRQTAVLAELLGQEFEIHTLEDGASWTLEDYGVQTWDYFALRRGNKEIEENCLQNQREWFQENAELSIISDYDHAVWSILIGDEYPYELLKKRLQVFCDKMGVPLQIKE